ncbi:zinc finger BED domain-containing protein 4-like [Garra rufa]|uniref:zinc finger BED domain-containing protein 4-like n=1 Tax=Garra rufa TaxID=137080 RepID=UPI003CCE9D01
MEMIALDDQPFSIVEDWGFRRLIELIEPRYSLPSPRYFSDVFLPALYEVVATHIHKLLDNVTDISFTTDIWSSDISQMSMLSLTTQWINENFELKRAVLHAQKFAGSHTGVAIAGAFDCMFATWKIKKDNVHVVLRDNARNMQKAMEECGVKSLGCMAHTLGTSRLRDIQQELGMKTMMLQQDVATRWNSTFLMMRSLLDQKRALGVYGADHELPSCLSAHQWGLIENMTTLLTPFRQLTREISSHQATTADVILSVVALKRLLSKTADTDSGVRTALLEAVNERFGSAFSEPLYYLATILDPWYKDRYFDTVTKQAAVKMLQQQVDKVTHSDSATETPDTEEPQEKNIRTSDDGGKSLLDMHDEILEENLTMEQQAGLSSHTSLQVHGYLCEPLIPRNESPLQYWKSNMSRFPALAKAARKYLSAPCTSVDSERLFSAGSHIVDEKKNRIQCEKAEMLLPLVIK